MLSFDDVRKAVAATVDDDTRVVCLRLVDEIEKRQSERDALWTYQVFSSWLRREPSEVVQECVNILASAKSARLLQVHFLVFNPEDPEDIGAFLDDKEVKSAYSSGFLFHPNSGEKVENFEEWLVPYFTLGPGSEALQTDE
jgi:hypothetical protein